MTEAGTRNVPKSPRLRRIAYILLGLVLVLGAAGFFYENIFEARDRRFNPMSGRRVQVAAPSFSMHIDCAGEGRPAVVLESGLGDSFISWRKVHPQIAKFTQVCSYDRAGIGYSDSSSRPRTSQVMADELNRLLHAAGVSPPYVLAGHSLGGYNVRVFAASYRHDVAGVVLVDASHPDQENRLPPELRNMQGSWMREAEFLEFTMPLGIPRLLGLCDDDPVARAAECNFHTARESVAEMRSFRDSAAQAAASGTLGDLPLVVLSHDPEKPSADMPPDLARSTNEAWEKMQEELGHLSTRGTQQVVKNSAHYIQIDRPDAVVDAVQTIVQQVRTVPAAPPSKP